MQAEFNFFYKIISWMFAPPSLATPLPIGKKRACLTAGVRQAFSFWEMQIISLPPQLIPYGTPSKAL